MQKLYVLFLWCLSNSVCVVFKQWYWQSLKEGEICCCWCGEGPNYPKERKHRQSMTVTRPEASKAGTKSGNRFGSNVTDDWREKIKLALATLHVLFCLCMFAVRDSQSWKNKKIHGIDGLLCGDSPKKGGKGIKTCKYILVFCLNVISLYQSMAALILRRLTSPKLINQMRSCANLPDCGAVFEQQEVGQPLQNRLAVQGDKLLPADLTRRKGRVGERSEEMLVLSKDFIRKKHKPAEQLTGGQRWDRAEWKWQQKKYCSVNKNNTLLLCAVSTTYCLNVFFSFSFCTADTTWSRLEQKYCIFNRVLTDSMFWNLTLSQRKISKVLNLERDRNCEDIEGCVWKHWQPMIITSYNSHNCYVVCGYVNECNL